MLMKNITDSCINQVFFFLFVKKGPLSHYVNCFIAGIVRMCTYLCNVVLSPRLSQCLWNLGPPG